MDVKKLKDLVSKRASLDVNDDYGASECDDKEAEILSSNVAEAISFLQTCSEEEFYWLSEVFPDVIKNTQSKELFEAMCKRNDTLENQEYKESNLTDLKYAKWALND